MFQIVAALVAATAAMPLAAHDFWVQPQAFVVAPGANVPVQLRVGHGSFRQRWGAKLERIKRFADLGVRGETDLRGSLQLDGLDQDSVLRFAQPGTKVIVFATDNTAMNDLPAIRFNDYLTVEGLTPALATRKAAATTDANGRELYGRRTKALVQVGPLTGPQPQVTRPAGLTLEIVPQLNPYALEPGVRLPVKVLYEGKPLGGATVKLNNLDFDARPVETRVTDASGGATFGVPRIGKWQLNVIWTKVLAGDPRADYETIFSSLTFGYPPEWGR